VPFTSNYFIPSRLGTGDMMDWETAFPDLLERLGHPREDRWQDFLLERATFRRQGLREALDVVAATLNAFVR